MQLTSVALARSIWLFPFVEFNVKGLSLMPCLSFLLERHNFLKFPTTEEIKSRQEYKFDDGVFSGRSGEQLWVSLSVYSDGIVADTHSSTEDSDYFLHDLLTALTQQFGFVPYEKIIRRRAYHSEVSVEMGEGFSSINERIASFLKDLQDNVSTDNTIPLEVAGITFVQDPRKLNGLYPFRFERAANAPFKDKRYFSAAPMATTKHLQMLEKLETVLTGF